MKVCARKCDRRILKKITKWRWIRAGGKDERFSFYVFSLPPSLFPDVFTSGLNLKKTLALDFSIIIEFPAIVVKTLFLKVPKWLSWFDLDQRDETGRRSQLPAAAYASTKNKKKWLQWKENFLHQQKMKKNKKTGWVWRESQKCLLRLTYA